MPRSRKRTRGKRRRSPSTSSSSSESSSSSSSSTSSSDRRRHRKSRRTRRASPAVSQNVVLSSVIPEFDPLVDDIQMWINVVEANARAFSWSDRVLQYQALQKLRNTAKTWYDSLQKNETRWTNWKWKDWRNTLLDTFQIKRNMFSLLKDLIQIKPTHGQSLYEFYFQQKSRIDKMRLSFSEQDIISIVVGSIGDINISTAAEAGSFKYCDDLASFLHGKIHSEPENKPLQRQSSSFNKNVNRLPYNQLDRRPESSVSSNSTIISSPIPTNNPNISCFRCGELGHKKTNCSHKENVKCTACNRFGHLELACRSKPKTNPKIEKDSEIKLIIEPDTKDKFYKDVEINGCKQHAFIDMGSSCSLITSSLAQKLNLNTFYLDKPVMLTGFKVDSYSQVTKAVQVDVEVDTVKLNVTMYILDELSGCPILIGRNFTEDKTIMYLRIGSNLTFRPIQKDQVALIESTMFNCDSKDHIPLLNKLFDQYPQVVSKDLHTLGQTSCVELDIELTTNKPVCHRPYRMSESEKLATRQIVDDLLRNGIIQESNSAYASPVLLVDKPSGEKRMCVDYRSLNKITVKEKYPMPIVEDLIDKLRGCKCYTSLDLKSGYYQINVSSSSIHKTAFVTPDGHFEFKRMPFGLCNAPSVFQRLMHTVLGKLRFDKVICYMDDLLIATESVEENVRLLEEVLKVLQNNGLTINLEKCHFFQTSVSFLGYDISADGVRPGKKKLKAVEQYPEPKNVHQVRQFLGLINYFRKFIRNCALISKPLLKLLKMDALWEWGVEQTQAVDKLKHELLHNALLTIFDPNLPTILYTDASRDGIGCILTQITENGEKPIHFYSRQTSNEEKKYHSFELEFLAIVVGLQKFRHYLLGSTFKIYTDCNAVKYTINKQEINSRIGRWVLLTQEFTFEILHKPGTQMQHVDALSRNPVSGNPVPLSSESVLTITEGDWLLSVQLQDPNICAIREILESGQAELNVKIFNDYELLGNKVYRRTEYGRRWLVPKKCIWQIIRSNHDDIGHFAVDKTMERIKSLYWFPKMKKIVSKYIKNCIYCIYSKNVHGKKEGKLFPIPKYARPFHTLHMDHLGPFVKTSQKNTYLLVLVDSFTKFVFISPVRNTKSKTVINELNKIFKIFGNPRRLICDAGSAFTSKWFVNYCQGKNIRQHVIATAVPRSNGQVERFNRTILDALRTMGSSTDNNQWDKHIASIQQGINSTISKTTSATPSEVFFGYRLQTDSDQLINENEEQLVDVTKLRNSVNNQIQANAEKQKRIFDAKRKPAKNYDIDDLVVIKIPSQSNDGQSTKLLPLFKGPFQVTEVLGHDRYKVRDMRGAERTSRRYEGITCAENMKPWIRLDDLDENLLTRPDVVK